MQFVEPLGELFFLYNISNSKEEEKFTCKLTYKNIPSFNTILQPTRKHIMLKQYTTIEKIKHNKLKVDIFSNCTSIRLRSFSSRRPFSKRSFSSHRPLSKRYFSSGRLPFKKSFSYY